MRIIVTGGAGFIGSATCRHLINNTDHEVFNVDKLTYSGNLASLKSISDHSRYHFYKADICDEALINSIVDDVKPDGIMHLAAESHVDRSIAGSKAFVETNVLGTHVMLEAARRHWNTLAAEARSAFRFLHVSTDEVYGSLGESGLFTEDTPYDPSSPYSASKAASDLLAVAWHRTYGLPVVVSNCSNNYGPYHFPEKLIPLVILNALEGKPLPVYGSGSNVRDWLYVEDHAAALIMILSNGQPGRTYNVGGRNERTNLEVVHAVCDILDRLRPAGASRRELISFVTDRPGHDQRYAIDATRIESELGWKAQAHFDLGLELTVKWYLENEWWWRPLRDGVYSGERLGLVNEARVADGVAAAP